MPDNTDINRLIDLLNDWEVPFRVAKHPTGNCSITVGLLRSDQETPKVTGYTDFYTDFEFDNEGQFITMGAWE